MIHRYRYGCKISWWGSCGTTSPTPGSGNLGEMKGGTQELGTGKLSEGGDRLPGEWVADPIGQDDRPVLKGLPGVGNIFLRWWLKDPQGNEGWVPI